MEKTRKQASALPYCHTKPLNVNKNTISGHCIVICFDFIDRLYTALPKHAAMVVPKHSLVTAPIPVGEFPDHVKQMHLKGKDSFAAEFKVCACTKKYVPIIVMMASTELYTICCSYSPSVYYSTAVAFCHTSCRVLQDKPLSPLLWERGML